MTKYAYIHPDEDGNTLTFVEEDELDELLDNPREFAGIETFVGEEKLEEEADPQNWDEGEAMLVKIEVIKPKEKTKAWVIEDD